jgi:hypothetical protein
VLFDPRSAICRRRVVGVNPERSYLTVSPTSECEIEVPGIRLSPCGAGVLPLLPPQAVNPRIANAIASAPAVTLRDLEVVCIFSSFPVYETGEEDFTALASVYGRIDQIFRLLLALFLSEYRY